MKEIGLALLILLVIATHWKTNDCYWYKGIDNEQANIYFSQFAWHIGKKHPNKEARRRYQSAGICVHGEAYIAEHKQYVDRLKALFRVQ